MAKKKTDNRMKKPTVVSKSRKTNDYGLNPRQEIFAQEVSKGVSATQAYRIVYGQGNYTDQHLAERASKLNAKVLPRINELLAERAKATEQECRECKDALMDIVRNNCKNLFYDDPKTGKSKMRTPQQLHDSTANAIKVVSNNNGKVDYVFHDKIAAIRVLAQINGWDAPKDVNVKMSGGSLNEIVIGLGDEDIWQNESVG